MKIRISPDGTVRGLWDDAVDWTSLGRVSVRRASHVEFCGRRQLWYVRDGRSRNALRAILGIVLRRPFGDVLHWSGSRGDALAWEQNHYQPGGPGWPAYQVVG